MNVKFLTILFKITKIGVFMKQNKISGVYKITNNITGDFYIGSSKDIKRRWVNHRSPSVHKQRPNSKLYKDMSSYGLDNFTFEIIEKTDNLKEREQYYIEHLNPSYNNRYASGWNTKRCKETHRRCDKEWHKVNKDYNKEWYKVNRDEQLAKKKAYCQAHRDEQLTKSKAYYSRLCLYNGETLTLNTLTNRFFRQGIANPCKEAKKYLL